MEELSHYLAQLIEGDLLPQDEREKLKELAIAADCYQPPPDPLQECKNAIERDDLVTIQRYWSQLSSWEKEFFFSALGRAKGRETIFSWAISQVQDEGEWRLRRCLSNAVSEALLWRGCEKAEWISQQGPVDWDKVVLDLSGRSDSYLPQMKWAFQKKGKPIWDLELHCAIGFALRRKTMETADFLLQQPPRVDHYARGLVREIIKDHGEDALNLLRKYDHWAKLLPESRARALS